MFHGFVPDIGLIRISPNIITRSEASLQPIPLDGSTAALKTKQKDSLLHNGVNLFNSIPAYIRNCPDKDEFKSLLDEFLQRVPDQPPVPGLVPEARDIWGNPSNCITDWVRSGDITPD